MMNNVCAFEFGSIFKQDAICRNYASSRVFICVKLLFANKELATGRRFYALFF